MTFSLKINQLWPSPLPLLLLTDELILNLNDLLPWVLSLISLRLCKYIIGMNKLAMHTAQNLCNNNKYRVCTASASINGTNFLCNILMPLLEIVIFSLFASFLYFGIAFTIIGSCRSFFSYFFCTRNFFFDK